MEKRKIKLGIYGVKRGGALGRAAQLAGAEIVAVCESSGRVVEEEKVHFKGATFYSDFEKFKEHPMDGVILANYFHEHAPAAISFLEKGVSVLSECASNSTMAEGVALVRAAEKSGAVYMLSENYPFMKSTRELKKICDGGTLGKILYAEGEYNHPGDPWDLGPKRYLIPFEKHWRNYLPRTYYATHSLAPIMFATGAIPKKVTAFTCGAPFDKEVPSASQIAYDRAAVINTKNSDGSVFTFTGCATFGAHGNSYRICGTRGQIENLRGMGEQVMLRYNKWEVPEGTPTEKLYEPGWNDRDEELIEKTGHGGGDFLAVREFVECVKDGKKPCFDVYFATTMASVAILAHRSVLAGGEPFDIPDFRLEEDKRAWENDTDSPFWYSDGKAPTIPCCSNTDYAPTEKQLKLYRELVLGEK